MSIEFDIQDPFYGILEEECPDCGSKIIEAEFSNHPVPDDTVSGFICEKDCGFSGLWTDIME